MFVQREFLYPALGKGPELRALLEERVKGQQASGRAISLSVRLFGGPEGNPYILNFRYQDLAALEAQRRRNVPDPAYQAKLTALLARPLVIDLFEVLIPNPASPVLKAPYFVQAAYNYPALGKGPELRTILEERVKSNNATGQSVALRSGVYGNDAPVFAVLRRYQDLATLESQRGGNPDPAMPASAAKALPLLSKPISATLSELLIPIPS